MVTLKESECLGACGDAPVLLVNDKRMCSFMNNERLDALLAEIRAACAASAEQR
jgi:NADH-quinone oxidoreductase subunit E